MKTYRRPVAVMWRAVVVTSLAVALLAPAVPASAASPTASATPNTGLADADIVRVRGAGFSPTPDIYVLECGNAGGASGCDLSTGVYVDGGSDGSFSLDYIVRSWWPVAGGGEVDCRIGSCFLVVLNVDRLAEALSVPLAFDARAPRFNLTFEVRSSARADRAGDVIVRGTMLCTHAAVATFRGTVVQRNGTGTITGAGNVLPASAECRRPGRAHWRLTVPAQVGAFMSGSAHLSLTATTYSVPLGRNYFIEQDLTLSV